MFLKIFSFVEWLEYRDCLAVYKIQNIMVSLVIVQDIWCSFGLIEMQTSNIYLNM